MGGGLEADLSHGAVPELWHAPEACTPAIGWRPVLQVAAVSHVPDVIRGGGRRPPVRHGLLLSDGVHSIHASFAPSSVHHLAGGGGHGALRRGSVVRLRRFLCLNDPEHVRTVFIIQLEILQTECALIGSPKLYKPARVSEVFGADFRHWFGIIPKDPSCGSSIYNKAISRDSAGAAW